MSRDPKLTIERIEEHVEHIVSEIGRLRSILETTQLAVQELSQKSTDFQSTPVKDRCEEKVSKTRSVSFYHRLLVLPRDTAVSILSDLQTDIRAGEQLHSLTRKYRCGLAVLRKCRELMEEHSPEAVYSMLDSDPDIIRQTKYRKSGL